MKHLFIQLAIQDGEREHTHRVLHTTNAQNINFAAEYYAAHYWGYSYKDNNRWYAWGGEISIQVEKVQELTQEEFDKLSNLFY